MSSFVLMCLTLFSAIPQMSNWFAGVAAIVLVRTLIWRFLKPIADKEKGSKEKSSKESSKEKSCKEKGSKEKSCKEKGSKEKSSEKKKISRQESKICVSTLWSVLPNLANMQFASALVFIQQSNQRLTFQRPVFL